MKLIDGLTLEQIEKYTERVDHFQFYKGLSDESKKNSWKLPTIATIVIMMILACNTPMIYIAAGLACFPEKETPISYHESNQHIQGYAESFDSSHAVYSEEYTRKTNWAFFRFLGILFIFFVFIDAILWLPWFKLRPRYVRKKYLLISYRCDKERIHRIYEKEIQEDVANNLKR
jgi:hypothetical protein